MKPIRVQLDFEKIHCFNSGESGGAEPYLWPIFFKIDGDSVRIEAGQLKGTANVLAPDGQQGNLEVEEVYAADDIFIPPKIGRFTTVLRPIPWVNVPESSKPGILGYGVIILEEDDTPVYAVQAGYNALRSTVQRGLDQMIPTLHALHPRPDDEQIEAIKQDVAQNIKAAVVQSLDYFTLVFGDLDNEIGSAFDHFFQDELEQAFSGLEISERWTGAEGDWRLTGRICALPPKRLRVSCINKKPRVDRLHHIKYFGGVDNTGQHWRLSRNQVIEILESGTGDSFYVQGDDGSRAEVKICYHHLSNGGRIKYLATTADESLKNNLLSLPECGVDH